MRQFACRHIHVYVNMCAWTYPSPTTQHLIACIICLIELVGNLLRTTYEHTRYRKDLYKCNHVLKIASIIRHNCLGTRKLESSIDSDVFLCTHDVHAHAINTMLVCMFH